MEVKGHRRHRGHKNIMIRLHIMWSYHLEAMNGFLDFENLNNLMKHCDINRGVYTHYIKSVCCYMRKEPIQNLDDPAIRIKYNLDA